MVPQIAGVDAGAQLDTVRERVSDRVSILYPGRWLGEELGETRVNRVEVVRFKAIDRNGDAINGEIQATFSLVGLAHEGLDLCHESAQGRFEAVCNPPRGFKTQPYLPQLYGTDVGPMDASPSRKRFL